VAGSGNPRDRKLVAQSLPSTGDAGPTDGAGPRSELEDVPTKKHRVVLAEAPRSPVDTVRSGAPPAPGYPSQARDDGHVTVTRRLSRRGGLFEADTIALPPERSPEDATTESPRPPDAPRPRPSMPPPPAPPPPSPPPEEEPSRYLLRGEYARGGQARVLLVWDRSLEREVAWKEVCVSHAPTQDPAEVQRDVADAERRLLTEARITGQLEHPSIVPVYELAQTCDGKPYYTMRRIHGEDLAAVLGRGLPLQERLSLLGHFLDLCHAIAFAHSRGVIHRDVKPHNVMIGAFGETVLLDWGLARRRAGADGDPGSSLEVRPLEAPGQGQGTLAGSLMGTPAYMSPEQARGQTARVDERTDIWGLGAVLYEILAGRPPHTGASQAEVLRLAAQGVVPPVMSVCREAPPELAAIAHKALEPEPDQRYPSAQALAEDVNAYLTGGRVRVFRYSVGTQLRRLYSRHRTASWAILLAMMVTLVALAAVTVAWDRERDARTLEREEKLVASLTAAEAHLREADRLQVQHRPLSAGVHGAAALLSDPTYPASPLFDPDFAARHSEGGRLWVDALSHVELSRLGPLGGLEHELEAGESLTRVGFPSDGMVVALDHVGHLWTWDLARQQPALDVEACPQGACLLALAPGASLATADPTGRVTWWQAGSAQPVWSVQLDEAQPGAVVVGPKGTRLAVASRDGRVHLLATADGRVQTILRAGPGPFGAIAFSPDEARIALATVGGEVVIVEVSGRNPARPLVASAGSWTSLAFSPDGYRLLGSGSGERTVIWDLRGEALPLALADGDAHLSSGAFSPDGSIVAVGGYDGVLRLWDSATGSLRGSAAAHPQGVLATAFSPDGHHLATAGLDGLVRVWGLARHQRPSELVAGPPARGIALSGTQPWLATAGEDGVVRVFDTRTGQVVHAVDTGPHPVVELTLTPDDAVVISAHADHTVRAWDLASGAPLWSYGGQGGGIRGLVVPPPGDTVVSAARDGSLALLDLETGTGQPLLRDAAPLWALAASPDGRVLATGDGRGRVQLRDRADGTLQRELDGHHDWVTGLAFSADGGRLASTGKDARVLIRDVGTGATIATLEGHQRWVNSVSFSADGARLLSAGDDGLVILWDVASARPLLRVRRPGIAFVAAFLPDGESFAFLEGHAIHLVPLARYDLPHPPPGPLLLEVLARGGLALRGLDVMPARLDPTGQPPPR
jgi:WD40 repeat protein